MIVLSLPWPTSFVSSLILLMLQFSVSTFIVPSLRQSVQEVLDNALKGRGTSNYELEFRTKSNEIRYLLVNATTRRDAENNIVGVVGVAQVSFIVSSFIPLTLASSLSEVDSRLSR